MNSTVTLTGLLPSTAYILAYTLPLLFLSSLLTFGGAFLTLDRTRSFAPRSDVLQMPASFDVKQKKVSHFYLEGGIGGLAIGYVFGRTSYSHLPVWTFTTTLHSSPFNLSLFAHSKQHLVAVSYVQVFPRGLAPFLPSYRHPRRPIQHPFSCPGRNHWGVCCPALNLGFH